MLRLKLILILTPRLFVITATIHPSKAILIKSFKLSETTNLAVLWAGVHPLRTTRINTTIICKLDLCKLQATCKGVKMIIIQA